MRLRILTNLLKSKSARLVAEALSNKLGYKVWRGPLVKEGRHHIRYGAAADKLAQYEWFKNHQISSLEFTTSRAEAKKWAEKEVVFARKLLGAQEGKGIVVCETPADVPVAPVYTKYLKKKQEFRVHIFKDEVVSVVEKRLRNDWNGPKNARIRNTANGYVFCHQGVVEPEGLRALALAASKVTGSDFKGVDVGYNEKKKHLFVIEVNSAPGIEGTNVELYAKCIIKKLQLKKEFANVAVPFKAPVFKAKKPAVVAYKAPVKKAVVVAKKPVVKKVKVDNGWPF